MSLRKWILRIHLYGGLLCFWYLIIFAITSLHFQHHFKFLLPQGGKEIVSERIIEIPGNDDKLLFASDLQNKLNIPGWLLKWQTSIDTLGLFHTVIQNPKAKYTLIYNPSTSTVKISETSNGIWMVFRSLHGFAGKMPKAPLLIFWGIYTYLCIAVVVFSIFSGIWLWAGKTSRKLSRWLTFSGIFIFSFLLMFIVYIYG